jgi:hypothetical protein
MRSRFWKYTVIVTAAHVLVLAAMFGFSILPHSPETPEELSISVDYVVDPAPPEVEDPAIPEVLEPPPEEPLAPEIRERVRPKIERSREKVRRPSADKRPKLTRDQIRDRLAAETLARIQKTKATDPDSRYMSLIYGALYSAWVQPSVEAVGGATATAEITFGSNGSIVARRLIKTSGTTEMDGSVMSALNAVKQVEGLPESFLSRHQQVTILFKVEG